MRRRGFTLIEVLVGIVVIGLVTSALLQAFISLWKSQSAAVTMPTAQLEAQQMATTLSNAFRAAVLCDTSVDTGCTDNATVESASATGCTIYSRNSAGTLVETRYSINGTNFQQSVNGATATTVYPNASLSLTYYSSSTYYASSMTAYTPTSSTTPNLVAVQIIATISQSGITSSYTTTVRVRNHQ